MSTAGTGSTLPICCRWSSWPRGVFREVVSGFCGQLKPLLGFFVVPHVGEVVPAELSQVGIAADKMVRHEADHRGIAHVSKGPDARILTGRFLYIHILSISHRNAWSFLPEKTAASSRSCGLRFILLFYSGPYTVVKGKTLLVGCSTKGTGGFVARIWIIREECN